MNADDIDDRDIANVLRQAGRRPEPPAFTARSVRAAVEVQWRRAVFKRTIVRPAGWSVAAGLAVASLLIGVNPPRPRSPGPDIAQISVTSGAVHSRSGWWAGWKPARQPERLHLHEELATDADGRVALSLPGHVSLRLDHNTRIELTAPGRIAVGRGAVYVDAGTEGQSGEQGLQIITSAGAVRHVGTQYQVRLVQRGVQIAVREGQVEFNAAAGGIQRAVAGERITVSAAGPVDRQPIARDDASWQWVSTVAPGLDIEGQHLAQFLDWVARETGRDVVYADPQAQAQAAAVVLSGSVAGLAPEDALAAVLPTTALRADTLAGQLVIASR